MVKLFAYIFCVILIGLGIFQISLIAGAPFGHFAWGGNNEVLPIGYKIGSLVSLLIYTLFGLIVLQKAKILLYFTNQRFVNYGAWFIFGYSLLGVVANGASRSTGERNVMTPVVICLAILSFVIARNKS
jgi:hypothetical protein